MKVKTYSFYLFFIILLSFSYSKKIYSCAELFSRAVIFNSEGKIQTKYKKMQGYVRFSDEYFNGNMLKAHTNTSAELGEIFGELEWNIFFGSTKEFKDFALKILTPEGEIKEEYKEMEGYVRFADRYFGGEQQKNGDMLKAHINTSAVLGERIGELEWNIFFGSTKEFRDFGLKILMMVDKIIGTYQGMGGYARFSDEYFEGDMFKAYINILAVLGEKFGELNWIIFLGVTTQFRDMSLWILTPDGKIKEKYKKAEGYADFSDAYFKRDMERAFQNALAFLGRKLFMELEWMRQFHGSTTKFREIRSWVLNKRGRPKVEYTKQEGYIRLANERFEGDMKEAYFIISTVLDKEDLMQLGWRQFLGSTTRYRELRSWILTADDKIDKKYTEIRGYIDFADEHFEGDMKKAYEATLAVFGRKLFSKLNWHQFHGSITRFKEIRSWILNTDNEVDKKYTEMRGYVRYADEYFEGSMGKAYQDTLAALGKELFKTLGWLKFHGITTEFNLLIKDFRQHYAEGGYDGEEGQKRIGDEIFDSNYDYAWINVSTLKEYLFNNQQDFDNLGWIESLK